MSVRVLIVDDSAVVREVLLRELSRDPDIEVVGTAPDPFVAREKIVRLRPDVVTLDIEMPRMDGLTFLRALMRHYPLPVVVVASLEGSSSQRAIEALDAGGVDVMCKPRGPRSMGEASIELIDKIKAAARAQPFERTIQPATVELARPRGAWRVGSVVAIGASTGGPQALSTLLPALPADFPPTVLVQHMPARFTAPFARRLDESCAVEVREARDGEALRPGVVLIAPGGTHTVVVERGADLVVRLKEGPLVERHRPSVDVLFKSLARVAGARVVAALLTGMGSDGADGLLEIRRKGGLTLAQSKESSVVWGMPREAVAVDAVDEVVHLERMAARLVESLR